MRMGIILPKTQSEIYYQRFQAVFSRDFQEVEVEYLFYGDYKESPDLLRHRQKDFDAVIIAGSASYFFTESNLRQETAWLYLPREGSAIYRALLLALRRGWDITRLSFDSYEYDMLLEVYRELGYSEDKLRIHCYKGNLRNPDYNQLVMNFHRDCLASGQVSGCITRLSMVANLMEEQQVPYVFAYPTIDTIREQISFAQKLVMAMENGWGQFSVLAIHIDLPPDYTFLVSSDYSIAADRLQIANHIYRYANLIRGTALEQGVRDYIIISTMDFVESQTNFYKNLPLMDWLAKGCPYTISVGIGCAETVAEAHRLAGIALRKCLQRKKSAAMVQFGDGTFLFVRAGGNAPSENASELDQWQEVAQRSGVSASTIYRIAELIHRTQTDSFTAQELADGLRIGRRSADRVLEKLEAAGYASVAGRELSGKKGRPARVTRIFLTK